MNTEKELIPTRQTLLSRLKDRNDQESWRDFVDTYGDLIYNAAMKAGLNDAESQDVVQETVISVLKTIGDFQYDPEKASFKGWLVGLTKWRIVDQIRKRQPKIEHQAIPLDRSRDTATAEGVAEPGTSEFERIWDEEWEDNLRGAAIRRVKKKVEPRHYQLFDLHAMQGWPVIKVARIMKVNPGQVYLVKHRVGGLIKKEMAYLREHLAQVNAA